MSRITVVDLEVHYCVGVGDEERAQPQKLLVTVDLSVDFTTAALTDRVEKTINYQNVVDDLLKFGEKRGFKLIEKVANSIVDFILAKYRPDAVFVEVKKFVIPQARYVSVSLSRARRH